MTQNHLDNWQQVQQLFQKVWGYDSFRSPQGEIIQCLLQSQDALIVMPTGAGKSLCFQLPALFKRGLTLVISPLVALMENQVAELRNKQLPADLLHNEIPRQQRKITIEKIKKQQLRLLYLSPETLLTKPIWEVLTNPHLRINGLILDEAHCLVQWGETFRPAYRRLGAIREALQHNKPPNTSMAIAAFTATADAHSQHIIKSVLRLKNPQLFSLSPYRSNLNLTIKIAWTPRCRNHQLLQFIQRHKRQSGLIYVRSRRETEGLSQWLTSLNYQTAAYHAGLSPQTRREIEEQWLTEKRQFVVCTSAFGLGINKPNVRWIAHFQAPFLLSEYLQEIGRGGRDGQPANTLTLISEPTGWLDPSDQQRYRYFVKQIQQQYYQLKRYLNRIPRQGKIQAIAQEVPQGEIILSLLHSWGQLEWLDPFTYQLISPKVSLGLQKIQQSSQQATKQMKQYLMTHHCRWQFLLNAFGFQQEARGFYCGHCDNCHRHKYN